MRWMRADENNGRILFVFFRSQHELQESHSSIQLDFYRVPVPLLMTFLVVFFLLQCAASVQKGHHSPNDFGFGVDGLFEFRSNPLVSPPIELPVASTQGNDNPLADWVCGVQPARHAGS